MRFDGRRQGGIGHVNGHRDFGVETISEGRPGMIGPLRPLLSCIESLSIAKQLKSFHGRDISVGGVKPGEVVLCRRSAINNITMSHTDLREGGLHHKAGRTG